MNATAPAPLGAGAAHRPRGNETATETAPPPPHPAAHTAQHDTVSSQQLLQGRSAITITHNGTAYRLQATRLGKLILTK